MLPFLGQPREESPVPLSLVQYRKNTGCHYSRSQCYVGNRANQRRIDALARVPGNPMAQAQASALLGALTWVTNIVVVDSPAVGLASTMERCRNRSTAVQIDSLDANYRDKAAGWYDARFNRHEAHLTGRLKYPNTRQLRQGSEVRGGSNVTPGLLLRAGEAPGNTGSVRSETRRRLDCATGDLPSRMAAHRSSPSAAGARLGDAALPRDIAWYDRAAGWWASAQDPLRFPMAQAVPRRSARVTSFEGGDQAANGLDDSKRALRQLIGQWERAGILSEFQADELALTLQPFRGSGIKRDTLRAEGVSDPSRCAIFDEIWTPQGRQKGMVIVSHAPLSAIRHNPDDPTARAALDIAIFGLPPATARLLVQHYEGRLAYPYGDNPCSQWRPEAGRFLNVVASSPGLPVADVAESRSTGQSRLAPTPLGGTFVLRDANTGICYSLLLEMGFPEDWARLSHVNGNQYVADTPAGPKWVELNPRTSKGRVAVGHAAAAFLPDEFEVDCRIDGRPYVWIENQPCVVELHCPHGTVSHQDGGAQAGCVASTLEFDPVERRVRPGNELYVEPLSKTWHTWKRNGVPVFSQAEVSMLRQLAVPFERGSSYIESKNLLPGGARLYAVGEAQLGANPERYDVIEMGGALVSAEVKQSADGTLRCEVFDRHASDGPRYPVHWDGWRWRFDRHASRGSDIDQALRMSATVTDAEGARNSTEMSEVVLPVVDEQRIAEVGTEDPTQMTDPDWTSWDRIQSQPLSSGNFSAVDAFYRRLNDAFPDIWALARTTMQRAIREKLGIEVDPDDAYLMRFELGYQDGAAVTGWGHGVKPLDERTLTACLLTNFPARDQENPWSLDALAGVYEGNSTGRHRFDHANEVRVKPSTLMKLVWDIDFYEVAKAKLDAGWQHQNLQEINNGVALARDLKHVAPHLTAPDVECVLGGVRYLDSPRRIEVALVEVNGYLATDMLTFQDRSTGRIVLYLPRRDRPDARFVAFAQEIDMRQWFVESCRDVGKRRQFARHFSLSDRQDGMFKSGVDHSLAQFAKSDGHVGQRRVGRAGYALASASLFRQLAERQRARSYSDLDLAVKSDTEVSQDVWTDYIDAVNFVMPNPVTPFVSLGLHIDKAIEADTDDERRSGLRAALSDAVNLALMAVTGGLGDVENAGFSPDGEYFQARVSTHLKALSEASVIEWDGKHWIPEQETSTHVSSEVVGRVTPDMFSPGVTSEELGPPDRMGIRQRDDGTRYLKIGGRFAEIRKWRGTSNRFVLGARERWLVLRLEDGVFRAETLAERLAVIGEVGLGGRHGKLTFELLPSDPSDLTTVELENFQVSDFPPSARRALEHIEDKELNDAERGGRDQIRLLSDRLDNAAKDYLSRLPRTPRAQAPVLPADLSDAQSFAALFARKEGIVLGELHDQPASRQLLIENMAELKRQGVRTLYVEGFLADLHQSDIDAYLASPAAPLSDTLQAWVDERTTGRPESVAYNYKTLLGEARTQSVAVRAIDSIAAYYDPLIATPPDFLTAEEVDRLPRLRKMNYFGAATIRQHQAAIGGGKWVALVGRAHVNTNSKLVAGIAELADGTGVRVKVSDQKPIGLLPGYLYKGRHKNFDYVWTRRQLHVPQSHPDTGLLSDTDVK